LIYRAVLVGAGGMGRAWAKNILATSHRVQLVGWVDIVDGKAKQAISELTDTGAGSILDFSSLEEALEVAKPDFVVDVSIPEAHEIVTVTALRHGIAVLGEKPMSVSLSSARRMLAAADASHKLYMVSQSRRYDSALVAFKQAIESLGGAGILTADFFIGAHFGGFRDVMPDVLLKDMAIHTFDAARYLIGTKPVTVYCDSFRVPWSWYFGDESALASFEFENGTRFSYRGSWAAEGHQTEWEACWRAVCPGGTVTWDGTGQVVVDKVTGDSGFVRQSVKSSWPIDELSFLGIAGSLNDFLDALDQGTEPMGLCTDNIWSLAMVLYSVESSRLGQKVEIAI
jgi:predicted dehydrogenase